MCTSRLQGWVPTAGVLQISCGDCTPQVPVCHQPPSCPVSLPLALARAVICVFRAQLVCLEQRGGRGGWKGLQSWQSITPPGCMAWVKTGKLIRHVASRAAPFYLDTVHCRKHLLLSLSWGAHSTKPSVKQVCSPAMPA